jgi:hypothetical protein
VVAAVINSVIVVVQVFVTVTAAIAIVVSGRVAEPIQTSGHAKVRTVFDAIIVPVYVLFRAILATIRVVIRG